MFLFEVISFMLRVQVIHFWLRCEAQCLVCTGLVSFCGHCVVESRILYAGVSVGKILIQRDEADPEKRPIVGFMCTLFNHVLRGVRSRTCSYSIASCRRVLLI